MQRLLGKDLHLPLGAGRKSMEIKYLADRPEHIPTLAAWHRSEWGHLRPDESLETRAAKLRKWSGRREIPTVLIASAGDTLLGSAMLVAHDMETRPHAFLTRHAALEAQALGFPRLYLYTFGSGEYYARLGWQTIGRDEYLGAAATLMSLDLP